VVCEQAEEVSQTNSLAIVRFHNEQLMIVCHDSEVSLRDA